MKMNRRELVITGLGCMAGWFTHRLGGGTSHASMDASQELNWKQPRKIDIPTSARIAYDGYKEKGLGCCQSTSRMSAISRTIRYLKPKPFCRKATLNQW